MQVILTGVSGSGKTSILRALIEGYQGVRPIQFTTRKPRNDKELDEYVFLTRAQFLKKLENGDFMEYTYYNDEYYAITKYFDIDKTNIFIVEPAGKAQVEKHMKLNGIKFTSFFLELPQSVAKERMVDRGDTIRSIENRLEDFKYFTPGTEDVVLDGRLPIATNVSLISKWLL